MTVLELCSRCKTVPVERAQPEEGDRFAALLATISLLCEGCTADLEREEFAEQERKRAEEARGLVAERARKSGLPEKHRVSLDSLTLPSPLFMAARKWAADGGGLLLTGEVGRGKTTIAGAACWERLQAKRVLWTSAPLLMARLGSGLSSEAHNWAVETLASRAGLVLDDIDKARPTEYGAEQMFLAVDQRVEHEAPLLVTSNLAPSQLAERWPSPYGPALASRLVGYCRTVKVEGVDRRLV